MTTPAPVSGAIHVDLRPLDPSDRERLHAWLTPDEADAWLGDPRRKAWIVEQAGAPAGVAGFHEIDRNHQRCAWEQHLATADAGLAAYVQCWGLEYAFEGLRFAKLWRELPASDEPSLSGLERFGFEVEARLRGHVSGDDGRSHVVRVGVLAADWRTHRASLRSDLRALGFDPPDVG